MRGVQRACVLLAFVGLFAAEHASAQAWYDINWLYRRAVTVTNPGTSLTDFQVRVTLDNSFDYAKSMSNGRDVRVTAADGTTALPFWIESWTPPTSATLWVRIPSVAGTPTTTTIYLYYGNSMATSNSNGALTFDFFDDFETPTALPEEYYKLSTPPVSILPQDQPWETSPPHTFHVVDWNHDGYRYWGYYGLFTWPQGGPVGLARSNDLVNWTKYSGNPVINVSNARWPTVILVNNVLQIFYNVYTGGTTSIVRDVSVNGTTFSGSTTTVVAGEAGYNNVNPNLFFNPNDRLYYLYWVRISGTGVHQIMARSAATIAGLDVAATTTVLTSPTTLAAPNMMYRDSTYFLTVERYPGGIWETEAWSSKTSPVSGFALMGANPILANGCACFTQHIFGDTLHAYYARLVGTTWTMEYRYADLRGGIVRPIVPNTANWTSSTGTWSVVTATQPDGTAGRIVQSDPSGYQILCSSYTGTDYVLEASGRQVSGNIWGLSWRVASLSNYFTSSLYENLDAGNNLYLYNWVDGTASTVSSTALGPIHLNTWYKMTVKAHGSTFDIAVNDVARISNATSTAHPIGAVGLFGENAAVAQYDDVRVRRYAASEPTASVGAEQVAADFQETLACTSVGGPGYSFALSKVAMNFDVLPTGGGSVTVHPHFEIPPTPTYPSAPSGTGFLPLWYSITSTMPDNAFRVTVTVFVGDITGFGTSSRLMYYNTLTGRWVFMSSVYDPQNGTITFSTTHFGVFAFVNATVPTYTVALCTDSSNAATTSVYPNVSWGDGYPSRPNDWGYSGANPFTVYVTPPVGMQLGAYDMTVQWDHTVVSLVDVSFENSLFSGPNLVSAVYDRLGTNDRVTINASMNGTNVTAVSGSYLARLHFALIRPGHACIAVIGERTRQFVEGSPPTTLLVIPQQTDVKAYVGDVAAGLVQNTGDGTVDFNDLAAWSTSYWSGVGGTGMTLYQRKYDIGPTQSGYVFSLPVHDQRIDFEDLVIFSIAFGKSARHELLKVQPQPEPAQLFLGTPVVEGAETRIPVFVRGGVADLRGLTMTLGGYSGQLLDVEAGELLQPYHERAVVLRRQADGKICVDMAILGLDVDGVSREGELLSLRFRGTANLHVETAEGRTSANGTLVFGSPIAPEQALPSAYVLGQNYPNPFNPSTTIAYQLPQAGPVSLDVFDVLGRRIATLVDAVQEAGSHSVTWNGRDLNNQAVGSGVYLYRLTSGQFTAVRRMLTLK